MAGLQLSTNTLDQTLGQAVVNLAQALGTALFERDVDFVADEGLPLLGAGRTEGVVGVREDAVGLGLDADTLRAQPLDPCVEVLDGEVVQSRRRRPIEQQPHPVEVEEQQSGWVEQRGRRHAQE